MEWQIILAWVASTAVTVGSVIWILAAQFSNTRGLIYSEVSKMTEKILEKLEYHEKHDDARFNAIQQDIQTRATAVMNDIWAIKVRNAAIDALRSKGDRVENIEDCRIKDKTSARREKD